MLGMLEGSGYEKTGAGSAASIHYVAEVMRRFYADRSEYFGDPGFLQGAVSKLLDPKYIASRRASIDPQHATPSDADSSWQSDRSRKHARPRTSTSWIAKETRWR